ncbi:hypothetical protein FS837_010319, partial [Tulasnella sp. UAMH 9824]
MADTPSDPHRQRYPSSLSTTTRTKRPFHQTTLSSESTATASSSSASSSSASMSSSVVVAEAHNNLADQVETGSARKRARNGTGAANTNTDRANATQANSTRRRDSVDDDRRSFVTAYESSPERPSATAATATTVSTGDSSVSARRRSVPPAASSSSSPPPTGPPSSTTSANTSMSIPSRYTPLDGVGRVGESSRFPMGAGMEEEEEDDRMDTDSPELDAEHAVADQDRGRPTVTSSVPAPLYRPSSSPEPSSSSSSTAGPSEIRNTAPRLSWRTSPPPTIRVSTRSPSAPSSDTLWAFSNVAGVSLSSFQGVEPTSSTTASGSSSRRSPPTSSSANPAQPRPVSLTIPSGSGPYQPSSLEFRSMSSARRFSETIDPLRRSPSPPSPPSPPTGATSSMSARRRQQQRQIENLMEERLHRTAAARASRNAALASLPNTLAAGSDAGSATATTTTARNGPRLPPVIGSFPITESDSSDEDHSVDRTIGRTPPVTSRPFSRSATATSRASIRSARAEDYMLASLGVRPRSPASSLRAGRSSPVLRTSNPTPPPMVVEEPGLPMSRPSASTSSSGAGASAMDSSSNRQLPPFSFAGIPSRSPPRRHHADDDMTLENDISPPIFAGPDDHDHGDDHDHPIDPAPRPPAGLSSAPLSEPPLHEILDMHQILGFHQQLETLGRLAENIGRGTGINRRTMQSAEMEIWNLQPRIGQHQSSDPEREVRLRTAYSNMARNVREVTSALLDADRSLQQSRRELEAAMRAALLEQPPSRAADDMVTARGRAHQTVSSSNPARRPVSMYDGLFGPGAVRRDDNVERFARNRLRMLDEQARALAGDEPATSSSSATVTSGAAVGNGSESASNPATARARRSVPQRSATSAPSTATPAVTVEDVPERASLLRERGAEGWSPLQISAFVPPPSPPRPLSRLRPASRYSTIDPYWIREDSVESMDDFDIGDYEYFRNMTWNRDRRQRPGPGDAESHAEGPNAVRQRLIQQLHLPPHPDVPPPVQHPTLGPDANEWPYTSTTHPPRNSTDNWELNPPSSFPPLYARPSRQNSELESLVVSPRAWDYASAGYTRPEVSPLTPSCPLPPAPRLVPRNLSMSEMQIRTGYTPQPSRNNSLVPPSPHGMSPGLLGGSRSLLMGDRSPLPRMVEEPEAMNLLTGPPDVPSVPWRGWTQDNIGRSDPPRPSIAITRSSSSSTSNPTSLEPELLVSADPDSPWLSTGPGRYTSEPEPSGFGNSLHVPLGMARPQSVADDIRRRLVTSRSRQRLHSGMSPSSPQAPSLAPPGPETAMQRINRFGSQLRRREDSLAVPRPGAAGVIPRVRRPMSITEEPPRTPPTMGPSIPPPGAPLDADTAATSFVRTAAERSGSPSPARSSGAAASQTRSHEERLATVRLRALRRDVARLPSLSRQSLDSLASDSSASRDSFDRLRRSASSSIRDFMISQRAETSRRSSGYEFTEFQYDTVDFPPFMESVIGGTFTAFSPPPMGGLSPDEISALPSSVYKDSEEAKKEERCPICLDD